MQTLVSVLIGLHFVPVVVAVAYFFRPEARKGQHRRQGWSW